MPKRRADTEDVDIPNMKVGDLKKELLSRGLDTSGKKADLVTRLEAAVQGAPAAKKIKTEAPSSSSATASSSSVDYSKMSLAELKKELQSKGLKMTGKKAEFVDRLKAAAAGGGGDTKADPKEEEDEEEIGFSFAKKALATEVVQKKQKTGKVKQRKVDSRCPSAQIYEVYLDWDCMLNQTNIGHNNNKYYVIQLLRPKFMFSPNTYQLWTRWGRVGEAGSNSLGPAGDEATVIKQFEKKFSDKTKNKWANRDKFKPVPGKYTLLEMDDDSEGDEEELKTKLAALDDTGPAPTTLPCTLDKPTQDLVKLLFNPDMFTNALKGLEIDTKKMPLGKLSKIQITKGLEALENIEKAIDAIKPRTVLAELTSKFYTIIPHDFGRRVPPVIADKETLQKKFDLLLVLGDIEMAQGMKSGKEKEKKTVTEVPHELDIHYKSLNCDLTLVDPKSEEYDIISKYTALTASAWCAPKIMDVWRVDRHKVDDRFKAHDGITNRRLLWHGTNVAVVAAILKSGLRIMPHSGGRVGKGIYLASENGKSASYVRRTSNNIGIMFLNEAALGKEHHITMDDWRLTTPPSGFDCIIAKGRTEPDSKDDVMMKMGSKDVQVPQGKPINTSFGSSTFWQSEYLVYKESQTRIRYLLKMKF